MKRRRFKKAARKAWLIVQEQPAARLTWREALELERFAKAHPELTVKNWELVKDPRPRYLRGNQPSPKPRRRAGSFYTWDQLATGAAFAISVDFRALMA